MNKKTIEEAKRKVLAAARDWRRILAVLRNKLLTGIVVAIPIVVTIWVLNLAYTFINGISAPFLARLGMRDVPGLGFFVTLLFLLGLGFMAANVIGRRILESFEKFLLRVPLVATVYAAVKQVIDSVKSFHNVSNFKRVVYIEYPSEGCKLIGFVTGQFYDEFLRQEMTSVVIPTAPNPMTGMVIVVQSDLVIESELTLEEAMKLVVSAGLVVPKRKPHAPSMSHAP